MTAGGRASSPTFTDPSETHGPAIISTRHSGSSSSSSPSPRSLSFTSPVEVGGGGGGWLARLPVVLNALISPGWATTGIIVRGEGVT